MMNRKYKKTELGLIPDDWKVTQLGQIAKIRMCKRIFADQTTEKGDIPFYKIGTFGGKPDAYISRQLYEEYKAKYSYPEKGDILVSAAGTLGRTVIYDGKDAYFQDSNIVWLDIDKEKICNEYLEHYYKIIKWASSEGSTISRLYNGIIESTYIAYPQTIAEQKHIAEALSDIDESISSLEKMIDKKKAIKKGTMEQLLNGKTRLPGFFGKWEYKRMKGFVDFQVGFPFSSQYFNDKCNGLRLIRNRDLKSDDQVIFSSQKCPNEYIVHNGDILIGMDGDFLPCIWEKGKALLNQRIGRLFFNDDMVGKFAYYAFQKPLAELQDGTGATTVKHLSHGDIKQLVVLIPPTVEEQEAVANVLCDIDAEIDILEKKHDKAQKNKQGMMQQLLTGKIRLV